jgi:nitrile hydratase
MNGPHDLGGQMGFGPVAPEPNEPVFHAEWEKRVLGLNLCCGAFGHTNIDASRFSRESVPPAEYLASSYYAIWFKGLTSTLKRHGFVTDADLAAGRPVDPGAMPRRVLTADDVPATMARGGPCDRLVGTTPRFAAGDRVRTRNFHPAHHTRLPRYARGKLGTITALHGGYVFPDTNAHFEGENPQHLYTVAFEATELWGPDADPTSTVSIDAWESYLERA